MQLKSILHLKKFNECQITVPTIEKTKFVLSRVLKMSLSMPGAEKWRLLTEAQQVCWICDQQIPTIVLYSQDLVQLKSDPMPIPNQDFYNTKTANFCGSGAAPTVQAQYTNWHPVILRELSELCIALSGNPPVDWLEKMHDSQRCRKDLTSIDQFNEAELVKLERMKYSFKQEFLKEWPRNLLDGILPFKKCQIINGHEMTKFVKSGANLMLTPVYCGVFLARAGR